MHQWRRIIFFIFLSVVLMVLWSDKSAQSPQSGEVVSAVAGEMELSSTIESSAVPESDLVPVVEESVFGEVERELAADSQANGVGTDLTTEPVIPVTLHLVTRVIDGDTIEVDYFGERRSVRYIGIDTPETVHPNRPVECFGAEASARNRELVANQLVRLDRDITDTDKYGRLLRYVYVGEVFVNERLVAEGFATVYTYPPDVRHAEEFRRAEAIARTERRGLWGAGCEAASDTPTSAAPSGSNGGECLIKGNISQATGERIYHIPGCDYYNQTVITPAAGEQWFCSEAEALEAGWRKARNCS